MFREEVRCEMIWKNGGQRSAMYAKPLPGVSLVVEQWERRIEKNLRKDCGAKARKRSFTPRTKSLAVFSQFTPTN